MSIPTTTTERARTGDLLRGSLRIDGWGTAVFGVAMLVGGNWLSGPLGLPTTWFVPLGVAMIGGAAALGLIAGCPRIPARLAVFAIAGNALSAAVILPLTFMDVLPLTGLGRAFMLAGAAWVTTFAALEFTGFRRSLAMSAEDEHECGKPVPVRR